MPGARTKYLTVGVKVRKINMNQRDIHQDMLKEKNIRFSKAKKGQTGREKCAGLSIKR